MRDQIGIGGTQRQVHLTAGEFDSRAFLDADDFIGHQFAADQELDAGAQDFQIAAAFSIDEQRGIIGFELRIQGGLTDRRMGSVAQQQRERRGDPGN